MAEIVFWTVLNLRVLKSRGLTYCNQLVDALLEGILKKFGPLLEDEQYLLAAALHPKFRLIWLDKFDSTKVSKMKEILIHKVQEAMFAKRQESNEKLSSSEASNNEIEEDDFSAPAFNQKLAAAVKSH